MTYQPIQYTEIKETKNNFVHHIELIPSEPNEKKDKKMNVRREQLFIDPEKCTGCGRCMIACAMKHHGRIDPGLSRVTVIRFDSQELNVPVICMACDTAPASKCAP